LDRYYGGIFAVDLASGARRIIAAELGAPTALALDAAHQRLFVANDYPNGIYSVDLATGASRRFSAGSDFIVNTLAGIAYDDQRNRVIAIDDYPVRLYAVDLETGVRTTISGQINFVASLGRGPDLVWPRGVAVDADRQVAFVTDDAFDAVIAVDLVSGDRQVIAK
jgi:sugar lactone lactonase YvrE